MYGWISYIIRDRALNQAGFEIIMEYKVLEDLIMHPDMARHLVFMDDGICYLIDDRVTNSAHGSAYRIMDKDFYTLLEELFQ